ncbi:Signal transduction histidine-protein kinase BarA [Hartmannibacter diazotrophicus]|uniref:histidine kinase n=1 Tax=Hartmannibacter diazotrophicus TaxID=1482074 RepID=A0A2C9D069_9HYPH|nr:ATP-binding protein [Hartmannibacter diazotrophicus]SON53623.1 Signal transduction histidine-protein kinase BarA [Hartmannibacter diazotrophicus]
MIKLNGRTDRQDKVHAELPREHPARIDEATAPRPVGTEWGIVEADIPAAGRKSRTLAEAALDLGMIGLTAAAALLLITAAITGNPVLGFAAAFVLGGGSVDLISRLLRRARKRRPAAATDSQSAPASGPDIEALTDDLWEAREQLEQLGGIIQASGDVVLQRDKTGLIIGVNESFIRLFGISEDEVIGRKLLDVIRLDDGHPLSTDEEGRERSYLLPVRDVPVETAQGTRWFSWTETCLKDEGDQSVIHCIGRDVTDRKATEAALSVARDMAEAASEAKSRFLAMVSHEIRTPLNGILGMINLLQQTSLSSEQQTYARAIETSGDALLLLINDLLDFSKIEAGRIDLMPEAANIGELVEALAELLAPRAQAKGIELAAYIDPDLPPSLRVDAARLRQVLFNLAGNGIKFTAEGGVAIEVFRVRAADEGQRVGVLFQIRDTGIGIDPQDGDRIFREFEQAEPGPARSFGGTGLGLAISRRLVHLMGGEIRLESALGAGACFSFLIRLDTEHETADPSGTVPGTAAAPTIPVPSFSFAPGPGAGARAHQQMLIEALLSRQDDPLDMRPDGTAGPGLSVAADMAGASEEAKVDEGASADTPPSTPLPQAQGGELAGRRIVLVSHALIEGPLILRRLFERGADVRLLTQQQVEADLMGGPPADVVLVDAAVGDPIAMIERIRAMTSTPVGIVIDPLQRPQLAEFSDAGYGAYMVKPVRSSSLVLTVRTLLGEAIFSPQDERPDMHSEPKPTARPGCHVLLCDDNEINVLLGRGLLERQGHSVSVAVDGRHAVAAYEEAVRSGRAFDIVLMDLHMPEMDGFEATRRIRSLDIPDTAHHPLIIALTADVMPATRESCEGGLFDDWASKPLQPDHLASLLAKHMDARERAG